MAPPGKDLALGRSLTDPACSHYVPSRRLKPVYRALRLPEIRLRKAGGESQQEKRKGESVLVK
ncbi:hypothetical protein [Methylobacterium sp. R2-1]|uniref:hypothetical protein n=1 Tax=Methylobacterium sp. R2-1 TaxID=2587064 RepID=UPI00161D9278|nr:hypothetical protein [Methylobacterium sp. R2-1]MBB2962601.1 hypothetical protein [Methylobacterium sp. R2-1]